MNYPRENILGVNFINQLKKEKQKVRAERIRNDILNTGKLSHYQLSSYNSNGEVIPVDVNAALFKSENTNKQGIIAFISQIDTFKETDKEKLYRLELNRAIAEVSRLINTAKDLDFNEILKIMGMAVDVGRAYVFEFDDKLTVMDNTYEWCSQNVEPQIDNLQGLESTIVPWWMKHLKIGNNIIIDDIQKLPKEAAAEKEILEVQDIKSLLVVPIAVEDRLLGFMGYDDVKKERKWSDHDVRGLRVVSDMVANAFEQKEIKEALAEEKERLNVTLHSIADGVIVTNQDGNIILMNKVAEQLTEYSEQKSFNQPLGNVFKCLNSKKKNVEIIASEVTLQIAKKGGLKTIPFESVIKNSKDSLIYLENNAAPVFDNNNEVVGMVLVFRDITKRKKSEQILLDYQNKLRDLASEILLIEERERRRIATELHDQIGQMLSVISLDINKLNFRIADIEQKIILNKISLHIDQITSEIRTLIFDLSSLILYRLGLADAVQELGDKLLLENNIKLSFKSKGSDKINLPDDIKITIYQSVRELFYNIIKHSKADKARATINLLNKEIVVEVSDNGQGFDVQKVIPDRNEKKYFGLFSIEERIKSMNGEFFINSIINSGTKAVIRIPVDR